MTLNIEGNIQGGWIVIRVENNVYGGIDRTLLGEIKYKYPDGPDLEVSFVSHSELFKDHPEDLEEIKEYMVVLSADASA